MWGRQLQSPINTDSIIQDEDDLTADAGGGYGLAAFSPPAITFCTMTNARSYLAASSPQSSIVMFNISPTTSDSDIVLRDRRLEHARMRTDRRSRRKLQSLLNMDSTIQDEDDLTTPAGGGSNVHTEPPDSEVPASDRQTSDFTIVDMSSEELSMAGTTAGASLQAARETTPSLMGVFSAVRTRHCPSAAGENLAKGQTSRRRAAALVKKSVLKKAMRTAHLASITEDEDITDDQ